MVISFPLNRSSTQHHAPLPAFDRTGRIINITVAPINNYDPPRLLNYLTAPHVCVWSAAAASCAVPGLFDSITLIVKEPNGNNVTLSSGVEWSGISMSVIWQCILLCFCLYIPVHASPRMCLTHLLMRYVLSLIMCNMSNDMYGDTILTLIQSAILVNLICIYIEGK